MPTNSSSQPWRVGVCGTTENTIACAESLLTNPNFVLDWVITPAPRPTGRKQELTPSPLETWARQHSLEVINVEKSLRPMEGELSTRCLTAPIDFLLVVDFGYLVPQWLLDLPHIAAVNVHPSALPKYRGSSPGQYVMLFGETTSAVTIMRMTAGLDEGPVIAAPEFTVDPTETQVTYYQKSFALAAEELPTTLLQYAADRQETPQPDESPTPIAQRFRREDGFIPWEMLVAAQHNASAPVETDWLSKLGEPLQQVVQRQHVPAATLIERATRALFPWPGVWTIAPERKGKTDVRMKVLASSITDNRLVLTRVQYDGESPLEI